MTVVSPGVQSSRETQRRGRGKCNGYASVSAAVAGYQKSKLRLLQVKEMLRLAPPLTKEQIAATVAEMEAILMPFLLAEQAAFEAGEAALPAAGGRRRCGIGKGRNLWSYSQLKAKEVNGDGEVQHGAPAYSQRKAKDVNGDGEVRRPPYKADHRGGKGGSAGCEFPRGQRRPPYEAAPRGGKDGGVSWSCSW